MFMKTRWLCSLITRTVKSASVLKICTKIQKSRTLLTSVRLRLVLVTRTGIENIYPFNIDCDNFSKARRYVILSYSCLFGHTQISVVVHYSKEQIKNKSAVWFSINCNFELFSLLFGILKYYINYNQQETFLYYNIASCYFVITLIFESNWKSLSSVIYVIDFEWLKVFLTK